MVKCRRLGAKNALVKKDEWQEMSLVKMVGSLVCDEQTSLMSKPEYRPISDNTFTWPGKGRRAKMSDFTTG